MISKMLPAKPKTIAYNASLRQIFSAQFARVKTDLQYLRSGHSEEERNELLSLIRFQMGEHDEGEKTSKLVIWLVTHFRTFNSFNKVVQILYAPIKWFLSLFSLDERVFDYFYNKWIPNIIHYRYTNFAAGVFKASILCILANKKNRALELAYCMGARGHFQCTTGNFTLGLASLNTAYTVLQNAHQKVNQDALNNPQVFYCFAETLGILALQLCYAGYIEESKERYSEVFSLLEKTPYFFVAIFCLSMKMYLALEELDDLSMQGITQKLKLILGEHFSGKFGLRTSAYSAFLAAVRQEYIAAKEQVLTSESFYSNTASGVELGRYHFLRALTDLEFGNIQGALQNSRRAISFMTSVPGANFQLTDSALLDIEVRLRAFLLQPTLSKQDLNIKELETALHRMSKKVIGAPIIRSRIQLLLALCAYLKEKYEEASKLTRTFKEQYQGKYLRLDYVLSQFDPTMAGKKTLLADTFHTETKVDASLIDQVINVLAADDLQLASANILRVILSAPECQVSVSHEEAFNNEHPYEIDQSSSERMIIKLFLVDRIIKFEIISPLTNLQFDERMAKSLNLILSIIHAGFQRQSLAYSQHMVEMGKIAAQVAHDIRSPTAAILMLSKNCPELPEERRIVLREAASRIQDIANNLLAHYRSDDTSSLIDDHEDFEVLASAAIASVISEKKVQPTHQQIQFTTEISHQGYFAFININLSAFKRMISNLINNASEAMEHKGVIAVMLAADNSTVQIIIRDQGKGMSPDLIEKIKHAKKITQGKVEGHGLGMIHLHETINKYNGSFDIKSQEGVGTEVILSFPRLTNPPWMADLISIQPGDIIVVVDDDISIHGAWDQRFYQILQDDPSIQIKHFQQGVEAIKFINNLNRKDGLFLLTDYELLQQNINGLDIIEQTKAQRSIVVTSHYTNSDIIAHVIALKTKVLPKLLASEIDIRLQLPYSDKSIDAVLIDDELLNHRFWLYMAKSNNKTLECFASLEEFLIKKDFIQQDTLIYVDLNLKHQSGLDVAKTLYELGFTNIYLATGSANLDKNDYPFLKGIIGKTPPF